MMSLTTKNISAFAIAVCLTLGLAQDAVQANFRVPGIMLSSSRNSQVMAASEQPDLYCGRSNGQLVGCWNKEKYDQWARSQGEVRNSQSFSSSPDYKTISIDQSQVDYIPTIELKAGETPAETKSINLKYDITLQDPQTHKPLFISTTLQYGNKFSENIVKDILAAAPAVMDFFNRQAQMQQAQQRFQQQLEYAQQKSQELVNNLRQESLNLNTQTSNSSGKGFTDVALGLLRSNSLLSPAQIRALAAANKIQNSDLRFSKYQMNAEAYEILGQQLSQKLNEKKWHEIPALVEAMTYAEIQGASVRSNTLDKIINQQGIIQTNSYFDNKIFSTSLKSENGQIVRRISNRYQALWAQSDSLRYLNSQEKAQFFLGTTLLSLGDQSLAANELIRGSGFLSAAQSLIDGLSGYGTGLSTSISDLVKSIPELAQLAGDGVVSLLTDPKGSWQTTANFITRLPEFGSLLLNSLSYDYERLASGNAYEKGEVLGKYTLDIIGMVTSAGSLSTAKNVTKMAVLRKVLESSKDFKIIRSLLNTNLASEIPAMGNRTVDLFEKIPAGFRNGLKFSSTKQPEIADAIAKKYYEALIYNDLSSSKYLERLSASKQIVDHPSKIEDLVSFHQNMSKEMDKVLPTQIDGVFSRAIPKVIEENGVKKYLTQEDVFKFHPSQISTEHRYTIGGELGQSGLYASEGSIIDTKELIRLETGNKSADQLIFAEKHFKIDQMLDLTDSKNLGQLGLVNRALKTDDYLYTQVIGDIAKNKGYKGIIFESAKAAGKKNIVIFN